METEKPDNIIVVLGSYNHDDGTIGYSSRARAEAAAKLYKELSARGERSLLLCTGGANEATRSADRPHGEQVANYLKTQGVPAEAIIPEAVASQHTLGDAELSLPIVERYAEGNKKTRIYVTTSSFHIPRAMVTFRKIFQDYPVLSCIADNVERHHPNPDGSLPDEKTHERKLVEKEAEKLLDYFPDKNPFDMLTQGEMACAGYYTHLWNERRNEHLKESSKHPRTR